MAFRLVLIGARGAGKSAVGARLAPRLGLPFVDTDAVVEHETGQSIAALLAAGTFRAREAQVLARVLAGPPAVVAAGGGAVLWEGFREAARAWRVVWLAAAPSVLAAGIRPDARARPSLTGPPADVEIDALARAREERYAAAAWWRIDTGRLSVGAVVDRIEKLLAEDNNANASRAD